MQQAPAVENLQVAVDKKTQTKNDLLSGLTVSLALVPEAVAFSFVAGVDPSVGLYAAFMVGLITAVFGRPGMISGATGAIASYAGTGEVNWTAVGIGAASGAISGSTGAIGKIASWLF